MGISLQQYQDMLARTSRNKLRDGPASSDAEPREADLHSRIMATCRERGWISLHGSTAHRTHRTVGEFDFVILADDGRVFLVECKSRAGKLRPEQAALIAWAERIGHRVHVVRSLREFLEIVENSEKGQ